MIDWIDPPVEEDDDRLIGSLEVGLFGDAVEIEVSLQREGGSLAPTVAQTATLERYVADYHRVHDEVLGRIFEHYRDIVHECRRWLKQEGNDPDELAPLIDDPGGFEGLLKYRSLHLPAGEPPGTFGMAFLATWDEEHGLGVRLREWVVEEIGEYMTYVGFWRTGE